MLSLLVCVDAQYGPDPPALPADAKCGWRKLAHKYATILRPDAAQLVGDALQIAAFCNESAPLPLPRPPPSPQAVSLTALHVYVGDDIAAAIARARATGVKTVYLRGGVHHTSKITLGAADSGLTLAAYPGESPWLSGGVALKGLQWKREQGRVWSASLAHLGVDATVASLRVDGQRLSPARYPNADPEKDFWPTGYLTSSESFKSDGGDWLDPTIDPGPPNPATEVNVTVRGWDDQFRTYSGGIGGTCAIYTPPFSFWCASPPFSTGCGGCFTWNIPSGVEAHDLANRSAGYTNVKDATFMAWRKAHWANWAFEVASVEGSTVKFGRGGFQGARGGPGSDYFIQNVREELDDPTEFYFDVAAQRLYVVSNATAADDPPPGDEWVAIPAANHTLIDTRGTQANPVVNLTLRGLGLRDTAWTMLQPHGVPSGGDWALERMAALFLEGTESLVAEGLRFERVDGNAMMLSKYHRNATVRDSEFAWLGGSAIALWGYTDELSDGGAHGYDGTGGDFPLRTTIEGNLFREIGIWEKQSSAVFQAKAARTTIRKNVAFNLARAAINFNDGFGGGDLVSENVLFNTCRESSDHGPINSWDRQPFLTTVRTGAPSTQMEWRTVTQNLVVANYGGSKEVDNDDGSLFYHNTRNVMLFGWGQKFKCGAIESVSNLKLWIDVGAKQGSFGAGCLLEQAAYHPNRWHNDTIVYLAHGADDFDYRSCWGAPYDRTRVTDNTLYVADATTEVVIAGGDCPGPKQSYTLDEFQALGMEPGSRRVTAIPPVATLVGWAEGVLGSFA